MTMGAIDYVVLAGYFCAIVVAGFVGGRREHDTRDFFLGGRRQPWLLVGLSVIATEVSALTFIAVPAEAFHGDWTYLQMYAGSFLGRVLIVLLLLPAFYRGAVTTVYEYLGRRFGPYTRTSAASLFVLSRIVGSGIRLLAASLAIATVFDWPLPGVVAGCAAVAILYTSFGGIKAIMWTDAVQALFFLGGGAALLIFLAAQCGGLSLAVSTAHAAGKLHVFTWDPDPNNDQTFWVLAIHSTLISMAALGTDQDLTQRLLTCRNVRQAQRSLMFSAFAGLPVVVLFLLVGSLMFVFGQQGGIEAGAGLSTGERIFPYFISRVLPGGTGMKGLLIAGIFAAAMSSLDSALGALSSSAVTDFYRRARPTRDERHYLRAARLCSAFFGVGVAGVALAFASREHLLWATFEYAGLIFGAMLGIFLVGVTTRRRGSDRVNPVAMITSVVMLVAIKCWQDRTAGTTATQRDSGFFIAWPWWIGLGTTWTYLVAICFSTGTQKNAALFAADAAK